MNAMIIGAAVFMLGVFVVMVYAMVKHKNETPVDYDYGLHSKDGSVEIPDTDAANDEDVDKTYQEF